MVILNVPNDYLSYYIWQLAPFAGAQHCDYLFPFKDAYYKSLKA